MEDNIEQSTDLFKPYVYTSLTKKQNAYQSRLENINSALVALLQDKRLFSSMQAFGKSLNFAHNTDTKPHPEGLYYKHLILTHHTSVVLVAELQNETSQTVIYGVLNTTSKPKENTVVCGALYEKYDPISKTFASCYDSDTNLKVAKFIAESPGTEHINREYIFESLETAIIEATSTD